MLSKIFISMFILAFLYSLIQCILAIYYVHLEKKYFTWQYEQSILKWKKLPLFICNKVYGGFSIYVKNNFLFFQYKSKKAFVLKVRYKSLLFCLWSIHLHIQLYPEDWMNYFKYDKIMNERRILNERKSKPNR